jgi:methylated-DNA-protein-cysteine methyltransferase-like protein
VNRPHFFDQVYMLVRQIHRGRVASYGQIAALLGHPRAARTVGWALHALTGNEVPGVPWQRVINRAGLITIARAGLDPAVQRRLLESEGIEFDENGRVDMRRFGWRGLDGAEVEALIWESSECQFDESEHLVYTPGVGTLTGEE